MSLLIDPFNMTVKRVQVDESNILKHLNAHSYWVEKSPQFIVIYGDEPQTSLPDITSNELHGRVLLCKSDFEPVTENIIFQNFIYMKPDSIHLWLNGKKLCGIEACDQAYYRGFKSPEQLKEYLTVNV